MGEPAPSAPDAAPAPAGGPDEAERKKRRRRGSGRKPVFLEDQAKATPKPSFEVRGEGGFDSDQVDHDDPMPEMVVRRPREDDPEE
jgi:hypothetical protein